jgi:peptide/nickel transport system permease protein
MTFVSRTRDRFRRSRVLKRFIRHRPATIALVVLAVLVLIAIVGPLLVQDPNRADLGKISAAPTDEHLLGNDLAGRDVLARLVHGLRTSLAVGVGAAAIFVGIGTIVGLAAGLLGGWLDQVLMRLADAILSMPLLLLAIVLVGVLGPSITSALLVLGALGWPQTARVVRGQVLSVREEDYVTAARVVGVPTRRMVWSYVLPNVISPLLVVGTLGCAQAVLTEAALSFLGLGVQAPDTSLGLILNEARAPSVLRGLPWMWMPAAAVIAGLTISINFVGDGLRDAIDPRSARALK